MIHVCIISIRSNNMHYVSSVLVFFYVQELPSTENVEETFSCVSCVF